MDKSQQKKKRKSKNSTGRKRGRPVQDVRREIIEFFMPIEMRDYCFTFRPTAQFISDCLEFSSKRVRNKYIFLEFKKNPPKRTRAAKNQGMVKFKTTVSPKAYKYFRSAGRGYGSALMRDAIKNAPKVVIKKYRT